MGKSLLLQVEASRAGEGSALRSAGEGGGPGRENTLHGEDN